MLIVIVRDHVLLFMFFRHMFQKTVFHTEFGLGNKCIVILSSVRKYMFFCLTQAGVKK